MQRYTPAEYKKKSVGILLHLQAEQALICLPSP